jgi:hypothetical protein
VTVKGKSLRNGLRPPLDRQCTRRPIGRGEPWGHVLDLLAAPKGAVAKRTSREWRSVVSTHERGAPATSIFMTHLNGTARPHGFPSMGCGCRLIIGRSANRPFGMRGHLRLPQNSRCGNTRHRRLVGDAFGTGGLLQDQLRSRVMADGIAPTNDPIRLFRSPSYAIFYTRRLRGCDATG